MRVRQYDEHARLLRETENSGVAAKMMRTRNSGRLRKSRMSGRQRDRVGRQDIPGMRPPFNETLAGQRMPVVRKSHRSTNRTAATPSAVAKDNSTMALSIVGDMMQSYPFGVQAKSNHFLPYVDADAWAAEYAGADYRILVIRRKPTDMITSDICHNHYHRNKCVCVPSFFFLAVAAVAFC